MANEVQNAPPTCPAHHPDERVDPRPQHVTEHVEEQQTRVDGAVERLGLVGRGLDYRRLRTGRCKGTPPSFAVCLRRSLLHVSRVGQFAPANHPASIPRRSYDPGQALPFDIVVLAGVVVCAAGRVTMPRRAPGWRSRRSSPRFAASFSQPLFPEHRVKVLAGPFLLEPCGPYEAALPAHAQPSQQPGGRFFALVGCRDDLVQASSPNAQSRRHETASAA